MNILIVDDDKYILEGICLGVQWDILPITKILTARNAADARRILQQEHIDILLCDIEMPQENGLDLLAWLRGQGSDIQTVFLTSYAEFNYAQRALELGSFEYFLKPVAYDKLTRLISDAAQKVRQVEQSKQFQQYGQYWLDNEHNRRENFWLRLLGGAEPAAHAQIQAMISNGKLDYDLQETFVLMALQYSPPQTQPQNDAGLNEASVKAAVMQCCASQQVDMQCIWQDARGTWFAVLSPPQVQQESLRAAAQCMLSPQQGLGAGLRICFTGPVSVLQAYDQAERLRQMLFNTLSYPSEVLWIKDYAAPAEVAVDMDGAAIEALLYKGDVQGMHTYMDDFFARLGQEGKITISAIENMVVYWLQIVSGYLRQNHVQPDRLLDTQEYRAAHQACRRTVGDVQRFIRYTVKAAQELSAIAQSERDIVGQIEHYVKNHLSEDLTRGRLAEVVYLNTDYLAHLFKQEKGISLMRYINNLRMEKAKRLLMTTKEPVYTIAAQVGYSTSSYFSKQFKEYFGVLPNEYRKT